MFVCVPHVYLVPIEVRRGCSGLNEIGRHRFIHLNCLGRIRRCGLGGGTAWEGLGGVA